jgi:hypothetical protein
MPDNKENNTMKHLQFTIGVFYVQEHFMVATYRELQARFRQYTLLILNTFILI